MKNLEHVGPDMKSNVSCVEIDPIWFVQSTLCEEQTERANLRFHLFLSLHVESTEYLSSLIYPLVHQEEKYNSSHASADDNEDHDDNVDEDCMNPGRGRGQIVADSDSRKVVCVQRRLRVF
jgi:hypothetical protein